MLGSTPTPVPFFRGPSSSSSSTATGSSLSPGLSSAKPVVPLRSIPGRSATIPVPKSQSTTGPSITPPMSAAVPNRLEKLDISGPDSAKTLSPSPASATPIRQHAGPHPNRQFSLSASVYQSSPFFSASPTKRKASTFATDPAPSEVVLLKTAPIASPQISQPTTPNKLSPAPQGMKSDMSPNAPLPILNSTPYINRRAGHGSLFMPLPKSQSTKAR